MSITITGWYDVTQFGADNTGRVDCTGDVNDAIQAIPASGGVLYFPPGAYLVNSPGVEPPLVDIPSNVTIRGAGKGATTINCGSQTASVFQTAAGANNITIQELKILPSESVVNTAGAGIKLQWAHNVRIRDVVIQKMYQGIAVLGSGDQGCTDVFCSRTVVSLSSESGTSSFGMVVSGGDAGVNQRLHFSECTVGSISSTASGQGPGWQIENAQNVFMTVCYTLRVQGGFYFYPGASGSDSDMLANIHLLSCVSDYNEMNSSMTVGTAFSGSSASRMTFTGCDFSGALQGDGVTIAGAGPIENLVFFGSQFWNNKKNGITLSKGNSVTISGCRAWSNGAGGGEGIGVCVDGATNVAVTASGLVGYGGSNRKTQQKVGVSVTGTSSNVLIDGCDLTANVTALEVDASATNVQTTHNLGYNPLGWVEAPAIPSNGQVQNTVGAPVTVYISSAGAAPEVSLGTSSGSLTPLLANPPLGTPIRLGVGEYVKLTWGATKPTWQWYAD